MRPMAGFFITGVAGFLGSHFAAELLGAGHEVWGMDNLAPTYPRGKKLANLEWLRTMSGNPARFHFLEADLREPATWSPTLNQNPIQGVIHLAALAGVAPSLKNPREVLAVNVDGTLSLLEALRNVRIRRLVFASSSSVYGKDSPLPLQESAAADHPLSPYAASKRMGEMLCHTYANLYGFKIACLRFFTVYGPRQRSDLALYRFARAMMAGVPLTLYGDGSTTRDYTYIEDAVNGMRAALVWLEKASGPCCGTFNISGGRAVSLDQVVELLEKNLDRPAKKKYADLPVWDVPRTQADLVHSTRELNYHPRVNFSEGMARFCRWLVQEESGQPWFEIPSEGKARG